MTIARKAEIEPSPTVSIIALSMFHEKLRLVRACVRAFSALHHSTDLATSSITSPPS